MNVDEKIFTYCKYIKKACKVRNETIVKLLETLGGILENRHTGISTMNKKWKKQTYQNQYSQMKEKIL